MPRRKTPELRLRELFNSLGYGNPTRDVNVYCEVRKPWVIAKVGGTDGESQTVRVETYRYVRPLERARREDIEQSLGMAALAILQSEYPKQHETVVQQARSAKVAQHKIALRNFVFGG